MKDAMSLSNNDALQVIVDDMDDSDADDTSARQAGRDEVSGGNFSVCLICNSPVVRDRTHICSQCGRIYHPGCAVTAKLMADGTYDKCCGKPGKSPYSKIGTSLSNDERRRLTDNVRSIVTNEMKIQVMSMFSSALVEFRKTLAQNFDEIKQSIADVKPLLIVIRPNKPETLLMSTSESMKLRPWLLVQ